jgi:hypothetical protein
VVDIKKQIEALAKDAGINAKGARPCCHCDTYQNAVAIAEELTEELARAHCPDMTFAILMIAASRYKAVAMRAMGVLPAIQFIAEMANQSNDLGMPLDEFQNAVAEWHDSVNPHKEGS